MSIPETGISLAEFESSFLGSWKVSVGLMVRTHRGLVIPLVSERSPLAVKAF